MGMRLLRDTLHLSAGPLSDAFTAAGPTALMGQDVAALADWAGAMLDASTTHPGPVTSNPAVALGLAIAGAARAGRDKLRLVVSAALESLGLSVEQFVAESTGKDGVAGGADCRRTARGAGRVRRGSLRRARAPCTCTCRGWIARSFETSHGCCSIGWREARPAT
jgi:hypothetical protein